MDKKLIIGIVVVSLILVVGAYFLVNQSEKTDFPALAVAKVADHINWNKNSTHVIVMYSDLQCPACKMYHQYFDQKEKEGTTSAWLTGGYKFIYRHYPLPMHRNSTTAAQAAEAAGLQGKFFEMMALLFAGQETWAGLSDPLPKYKEYATDLKLDLAKFETDYNSDAVKQKIEADRQSGNEGEISATPTFFINGKKLSFSSFEEFEQALKAGVSQK